MLYKQILVSFLGHNGGSKSTLDKTEGGIIFYYHLIYSATSVSSNKNAFLIEHRNSYAKTPITNIPLSVINDKDFFFSKFLIQYKYYIEI